MNTRKKILFVTHASHFGGAEKSLQDILQRLDADCFEAGILALSRGPLTEELENSGFTVHVIDTDESILKTRRRDFFTPGNIRSSLQKYLLVRSLVRNVADYINREAPDLVYTNSTKAHIIGGMAGRRAGVPVIWHMRDFFTSVRLRLFYYWMSRFYADCVVCNSKFTAAQFRKHRFVQVIYNGIEPEKMCPQAEPGVVRREMGIPDEAPVVGVVGRLDPWKGHRVFIRAAARILEDIRSVRFLVVGDVLYGDEEYALKLRELASDYGIADKVIFTGFRHDVPDLLQVMDVYVHPSEDPEPFGRGIVEAMLMGKPVVASGIGGPEEIVRHSETGILVDPGDSVALARSVVQLLDHPEVARAFGDNGRKRAVAMFSLAGTVRAIQELLDNICA